MLENLNLCFEIGKNTQLIIFLLIFFGSYCYYNRKFNIFILANIDTIAVFGILSLIGMNYIGLLNKSIQDNLLSYILGIIAFIIALIQLRQIKEYEIISQHINRNTIDSAGDLNEKLEYLISSYKLLLPIIKHSENLNILIKKEIKYVIEKDDFKNFEKHIKEDFLKLVDILGGMDYFIKLLKEIKNRNNKIIKILKKDKDKQTYKNYNKRIDFIIDIYNKSIEKTFKKNKLN